MSKISRSILSRPSFLGGGGSAAAGVPTGRRTLERERDDLAGRRDRLVARLVDARTAADGAATRVRELLTAAEVDEAALARAERARNEANGSLHGCEDAHAEIVERLAAVERAIAEHDERGERERHAAELDARADRIERGAAELHGAAKAYRAARQAMLDIGEADAPRDPLVGVARSGGIVRAADHIAGARPLSEVELLQGLSDSPAAAAAALAREMRAQAAAARAGSAVIVAPPRSPRYVPPPTFPEVVVAVWRPAYFRAPMGERIDVLLGGVTLPEPIAAEAIRQDVAVGVETPEGKSIVRAVQAQPATSFERDDTGRIVPVRFTGFLGEGLRGEGKDLRPATPPVDLGRLPTGAEIPLAEAAQ